MARSEARILVEIWDDDDFIELDPLAQRLYLFLISQRDIEHTGVLPLRERRWAHRSKTLTTASIAGSLEALEQAAFIVLDEDTEEVLIRSFIRRDKVFRQPNVMRSALDHVPLIASRKIRDALAIELDRITETEAMTEGAMVVLKAMRESLQNGTGNPSANPPADPTDGGMAKGTQECPGERGKPNYGPVVDSPLPKPLPPSPEKTTPSSSLPREPRETKRATRIPGDFKVTEQMVAWARERTPHVDGPRETEKFINYWRAKSGKDATKVDWGATWRNWMLNAAERLPPSSGPPGHTNGSRIGGTAIPAGERCPKHRGQRKNTCGSCRADQLASATTSRSQP